MTNPRLQIERYHTDTKLPNDTILQKVSFVELKMAVLSASQHIPLAFHDSLPPTIHQAFPDTQIALKYHSASTKATCMLNKTLAPFLLVDLT